MTTEDMLEGEGQDPRGPAGVAFEGLKEKPLLLIKGKSLILKGNLSTSLRRVTSSVQTVTGLNIKRALPGTGRRAPREAKGDLTEI